MQGTIVQEEHGIEVVMNFRNTSEMVNRTTTKTAIFLSHEFHSRSIYMLYLNFFVFPRGDFFDFVTDFVPGLSDQSSVTLYFTKTSNLAFMVTHRFFFVVC